MIPPPYSGAETQTCNSVYASFFCCFTTYCPKQNRQETTTLMEPNAQMHLTYCKEQRHSFHMGYKCTRQFMGTTQAPIISSVFLNRTSQEGVKKIRFLKSSTCKLDGRTSMTPEEPHVLLSLAYLASHYICFKI